MKSNDTKDDQRYLTPGHQVPFLVMTDDQAQPVPDQGSPSHHMDILTARNQQFQSLGPGFPCTLPPDTPLGVTQ